MAANWMITFCAISSGAPCFSSMLIIMICFLDSVYCSLKIHFPSLYFLTSISFFSFGSPGSRASIFFQPQLLNLAHTAPSSNARRASLNSAAHGFPVARSFLDHAPSLFSSQPISYVGLICSGSAATAPAATPVPGCSCNVDPVAVGGVEVAGAGGGEQRGTRALSQGAPLGALPPGTPGRSRPSQPSDVPVCIRQRQAETRAASCLPGVGEAKLGARAEGQSRLSSCLSALGAPGFLLQLRLLPPRVVRAVLLASGGPRDRTAFQAAGLGGGSAWLSQLGAGRLARSATGDVEGLTLTAQELLLTCLVHFAQGKPPAAKPAVSIGGGGSSSGSSAQPNRAGDGTQGTDGVGGGALGLPSGAEAGWDRRIAPHRRGLTLRPGVAFASAVRRDPRAPAAPGPPERPAGASTGMSTIMMGSSTSGSGRAPRAPGSLSPAFERLLLAHLKAYLKHDTYELAYAHEPQATRFLLHLLHEFLIAPEPVEQVLPAGYAGSVGLQPGQPDPESIRWRAQPMPLYAARLVALHVLANPALRHECEEVGSPGATALGSHASRFTREVSLLGQPLIDFVTDLLRASQSRKQFSLEAMTSLTRLWLVLLQPWKAKRLLGWYHSVRSPEPKLEPPAPLAPAGTAARARGQVDVALLGLEPETASGGAEAPPPPLPEGYAAAPARRDRAGAGAAPTADSVVVVPGDGDARSWRSYVVSFHGAYCLLEAFLAAPLHMDLCLALARHRAATAAPASAAAAAQSLAAQSLAAVQAPLGAGPGDAARGAQLLRQKHVVAALKALGQARWRIMFHGPPVVPGPGRAERRRRRRSSAPGRPALLGRRGSQCEICAGRRPRVGGAARRRRRPRAPAPVGWDLQAAPAVAEMERRAEVPGPRGASRGSPAVRARGAGRAGRPSRGGLAAPRRCSGPGAGRSDALVAGAVRRLGVAAPATGRRGRGHAARGLLGRSGH
ncbi:unnamed protein product [Prorocentrum cordatum]|uniref:E3 ubiquitin-protein ligase n=1 Tax=Prorocentrum cordatum TaxID=2364126 RepID=A0ABN9T260_9DINO|nr:unnamed protein product [Polarella glacialis]